MRRWLCQTHRICHSRALWALGDASMAAHNVDELLSLIRTQCRDHKEWELDLITVAAHTPRLMMKHNKNNNTSKEVGHDSELLGRCGAAISTAAATTPLHTLRVRIASTDSANLVTSLISSLSVEHLQCLDIHLHAAHEWSNDEADVGTPRSMVQLLEAVAQVATRTQLREVYVTLMAPSSLSNNNNNNSIRHLHFNDDCLMELAKIVRGGSSSSLERLALRHVELHHRCSAHALHVFCDAVCSAKDHLRSMDLQGSGSLLTALLQPSSSSSSCVSVLQQLHELRELIINHNKHVFANHDELISACIHALPATHDGVCCLQQLSVSQCGFGDDAMQHLHERVLQHEVLPLEVLQWSSNGLGDVAANKHLAEILARCPSMLRLDIRHNRLTHRSASRLAEQLIHAPNLMALHLRANRLGDEGIRAWMARFVFWPNVKELDLTRCWLTARGLSAVAGGLRYTAQLRVLRLAGNDLRPVMMPTTTTTTTQDAELSLFAYDPNYMRGEGRVPTSFELDRRDRESGRVRHRAEIPTNTADVRVFAELGEAVSMCRALEVMDLSDVGLGDDALQQLCATALNLPQLVELQMSSNSALLRTKAAVSCLTDMLRASPMLRHLNIAYTALDDVGLTHLCDGTADADAEADDVGGVLGSLVHLQHLELAGCRMTSFGVEALAATVGRMCALRVLILNNNNFVACVDAIVELLSELQHHAHVQHVGLLQCLGGDDERIQRVRQSSAYQHLTQRGVEVLLS